MNLREIYQVNGERVGMTWDDGFAAEFDAGQLRRACPCAACRDRAVVCPSELRPVGLESVGNYGIRITFSDGHGTGVYSFRYLRQLAACEEE